MVVGAVCSSSSFLFFRSGLSSTFRSFRGSLSSAPCIFFFFLVQGILGLCGLTVIWKLSALVCSAIWVS